MPSIAPAMRLLRPVSATPSIVYCESTACLTRARLRPAPAAATGSKAIADRPPASVELPSVSSTCMRNAWLPPLSVPLTKSLTWSPSRTIDARTPAPAALIASRTSASVAPAGTVTATSGRAASAVKLVAPVGCVPSWMRTVPPPTTAAEDAYAPLVTVWDCASCCTATMCCEAPALALAVTSTEAASALDALTVRQVSSLDSVADASRKAATWLCSLP